MELDVSGNQKLHPFRKNRFTKSLGKTEAYGVRAQLISGSIGGRFEPRPEPESICRLSRFKTRPGSIGDSGDLDAAVLGFILAV
jgi:hypothetical protein